VNLSSNCDILELQDLDFNESIYLSRTHAQSTLKCGFTRSVVIVLKSSLSKKEKLSKYVSTLSVDAIVFFADRAVRTWRSFKQLKQFRVDPPRIRVLTLPACCCAVAPATDMNRKAAAVDGTDRRTDRRSVVA